MNSRYFFYDADRENDVVILRTFITYYWQVFYTKLPGVFLIINTTERMRRTVEILRTPSLAGSPAIWLAGLTIAQLHHSAKLDVT